MKASNQSEYAALIGIDWADKYHDIHEVSTKTQARSQYRIHHTPKELHQWAVNLTKTYPNQSIAVCCELTRGPLIHALSQYTHITIFPVNPSTVAKYRKAFASSGSKNDTLDAQIQYEILRDHQSKLTPIVAESAAIRALAQLTESRRKLVQDRIRLSNRIIATLKNYYPQVLDWFSDKDTALFCDFLCRWPNLAKARGARKQTLLAFFNQHHARYTETNLKRIEAIRSAVALTDDIGTIEPNQILIELLVPQLKLLIQSIEVLDTQIKQRYKGFKDKIIFDSLPGAGAQLAPRLLVAFGENRDRYQQSSEVQKLAGIAPVIEASGQKSWTHWRYSCPKFMRQTFVEWAGLSVRYSFWAKAYYEQQSAKGKPHNTIIRALAFKWIRIVFRCWKSGTPYDESKYLNALKQKGSPLLKYAVNN